VLSGLKTKVCIRQFYENNDELDKAVFTLAQNLANYNPEALTALKQILWKDTENWDDLLQERAAISGKLVLSSFYERSLKAFPKVTLAFK